MSTIEIKAKGNKQIALRVEPNLEEGIKQALAQDGDASVSAWIKRIIRKELQQRGIEPKADTQNLGNGRNYGVPPGYAALQYTPHADPVLPRFGEMGYAPMPYTLTAPMAQFLQSQERSGFDHQRKAWYADPV